MTTQRLQVKLQEAAAMLSISLTTLYKFINMGEIPTIGEGKLRRIAIKDLEAWQDRHKH